METIMDGKLIANQTEERIHITPQKVKTVLITGNCYDTITFRSIGSKRQEGLLVEVVSEELR